MRIGQGFRICKGTVQHCCAARRSRAVVARLHKKIAQVSYKKYKRKATDENIGAHFSCWLAKCVIQQGLARGQPVVSWDDHAKRELARDTYNRQFVVLLTANVKSAPYFDACPITGALKCTTNSIFAKTTSKHANTRQNTHVSCGTSRQCAASSWAVT